MLHASMQRRDTRWAVECGEQPRCTGCRGTGLTHNPAAPLCPHCADTGTPQPTGAHA